MARSRLHNEMSKRELAEVAMTLRVFLISVIWATIPCNGLYNMSSLGDEYLTMASKDACRKGGGSVPGVPGLAEVVERAAWRGGAGGGGHAGSIPRATVALTTCDVKCLLMLFEPFIKAIEKARDGDFSPHLVIIGNGMAAFRFCERLRKWHKHHCAYDPWCIPSQARSGDSNSMPLTSGVQQGRSDSTAAVQQGRSDSTAAPKHGYHYALVQKLQWALEVVKSHISVLWTDMDVTHLANPLPHLLSAAPDADMVIQSEYWDDKSAFRGEVCRFDKRTRLRATGCTGTSAAFESERICCSMHINGGLWLVHPTPRGVALMEAWAAAVFQDSVVNGNMWSGSAVLDQDILKGLLFAAKRGPSLVQPLFKWDESKGQYVHTGNTTERDESEVVYRISAQRASSRCPGECGWSGFNTAFKSYWRRYKAEDGGLLEQPSQPSPPGAAEAAGWKMVCVMPGLQAQRLMSIHQNCVFDVKDKASNMRGWLEWSHDEARWAQEGRKVEPEW